MGNSKVSCPLFTEDGVRIALECDGEKFHSSEEQVRRDISRQDVLERVGFKFIRIRGSDYYRRREETVKKLYERLLSLNVKKRSSIVSDSNKTSTMDNELLKSSESIMEEIIEEFELDIL